MARQDKSKSGRVTPKGTTPESSGRDSADSAANRTPVNIDSGSSRIVPFVMFGALVLGVLMIVLNYVEVFGEPNNLYLFGGLGLVLVGIISATQYK